MAFSGRGKRPWARGAVFPLAGFLLLSMATHSAATEIAGVYVGTYVCGQQTIPLRLTISSEPGGTLGGLFSFQPPAGAPRRLTEIAFSLRGSYTPATGRFNLIPGRWVTRTAIGYQMVGVEGTFDAAAGTLRGKISNPACGALDVTRDASQSSEARQKTEARDEEIGAAPSSAAGSGRPPESCLAIIRWSSRFEREYAGENWRDMAGEMLGPKLINLFDDEYFTPYFGKPFDQMTQPERFQIGRGVMLQCVGSPQFRQQFQGGLVGMLERPFTLPAGGFSGAAVAPLVAERRRVRGEYRQTVDELRALPATADSYPKALAVEARVKAAYVALWPSEFKLFETTLGEAKRRGAEPLLVARVDAAIAGARNREGILKLDQVAAESRDLFLAVGPDIARREDSRLSAALAHGLRDLMTDERKRIDALGAGLAGLEAGVRWYREFKTAYQITATDESVRGALAYFTQRHSRDLRSSAVQVDAAIRKARSNEEVQAILGRYTVESDRGDPAAAPVFRAAAEQQWKLSEQQEREKFSEGERKLMTRGGELMVPATYGAPSEREIALVFLRSYENQGGEIIRPDTVKYGLPPARLFPVIFQLKRIGLQGCLPSQRGGFECRYQAFVHVGFGPGENELLGKSIQGQLLKSLLERAEKTEPKVVSDQFVMTSSGWSSPTLEEKIRKGAMAVWQDIGDAMTSVGCDARRARGDRTVLWDQSCQ